MKFHCTEETNFGLVHDYFPTINRNNDAMADVKETVYDPNNNLDMKEYIDLVEEYVLRLNDEGIDKY